MLRTRDLGSESGFCGVLLNGCLFCFIRFTIFKIYGVHWKHLMYQNYQNTNIKAIWNPLNFCFRVNLFKTMFKGPSEDECISNMRPSQILTLARIYYEYNNGQWRMCAFRAEKITSIHCLLPLPQCGDYQIKHNIFFFSSLSKSYP